jgi:hypothetical protein
MSAIKFWRERRAAALVLPPADTRLSSKDTKELTRLFQSLEGQEILYHEGFLLPVRIRQCTVEDGLYSAVATPAFIPGLPQARKSWKFASRGISYCSGLLMASWGGWRLWLSPNHINRVRELVSGYPEGTSYMEDRTLVRIDPPRHPLVVGYYEVGTRAKAVEDYISFVESFGFWPH